MDSWLDRDGHPATRYELHYGARMIRCFVERPRSVHTMLENAVARRGERGARRPTPFRFAFRFRR
jgi:long-chain acyl-CoA synthetase